MKTIKAFTMPKGTAILEAGTQIILAQEGDEYILYYRDHQNEMFWARRFNQYTRYPSYSRVNYSSSRPNNSLLDYAKNEFDLCVSIAHDHYALQKEAQRLQEYWEARTCSLEDLPLVMTRVENNPDALSVAERRLLGHQFRELQPSLEIPND